MPIAKFRPACLGLAVTLVIAPALNGCNSTGGAAVGALAGGAGGALLGKKLGGTTGAVVGGLLGAGLGGFVGYKIGQYLNPEEKKQASYATQQALNSPVVGPQSTRTWNSPTTPGTSGGTTVTQQMTSRDGRVCRKTASYAKVKGQNVRETEVYCRDPQTGGWVLQA